MDKRKLETHRRNSRFSLDADTHALREWSATELEMVDVEEVEREKAVRYSRGALLEAAADMIDRQRRDLESVGLTVRFVENSFGRNGPILFLDGIAIPEQLDTRIDFPVDGLPTFTVSFYLGGKSVRLDAEIPTGGVIRTDRKELDPRS